MSAVATYEAHPAAELFPLLDEDALEALAASIAKVGLIHPIVLHDGLVLDGRNRLRACELAGVEPRFAEWTGDGSITEYVVSTNLVRRHLTPSQCAMLATDLLPLLEAEARERQGTRTDLGTSVNDLTEVNGGRATERAAKLFGTNRQYVADAKSIAADRPDLADQVRTGKLTLPAAKQAARKDQRDHARRAAAGSIAIHDNILVGDFRELADRIPDGSLNLIVTDPPYDQKASKLIHDLGAFAATKLAEGGSLICYMGHVHLFDAHAYLNEHLRYWWTCCCLHAGGSSLMREYAIRPGWKPILWFVRGTRHDKTHIMSDVVSGGREKDAHDWQQAESEAAHFIENLCPEDGIVCDPFLGSGTTALAAERLGRRWIGMEIDPSTARIASARIGCSP
jgi:hypothetical protein